MRVERVRAGDAVRLRELRLRALADAPYAFAATLSEEAADPLEAWEELAQQSEEARTGAIFVVDDGDRWLGMAGCFRPAGRAADAVLWGMWVSPEIRRSGVAIALVEAVAGWARESGATRLECTVSERAHAAAALYRRLGFLRTGERGSLASDPAIAEVALARPL